MRERLRHNGIRAVLAILLGALALNPAWSASCKQVPMSAPLQFIGPNLIPAVVSENVLLTVVEALDLARPKIRVTYRAVGRGKAKVMKQLFGDDDMADFMWLPARFNRFQSRLPLHSVPVDLEKNADELVVWDATIGAEGLFEDKDVEISLHDGYIKQFDTNSACEKVNLAYWDPEAEQIPLSRFGKDGIAHFPVKLNGVLLDAIFSTIDARSMITPAAALRAGLAAAPGGNRQSPFKHFDLGTEQVNDGVIDVVEHGLPSDIVLGNEFLRAHRILISRLQNKLYLSYLSGDPFPHAEAISYWEERDAQGGNGAAEYMVWQKLKAGAHTIDRRPADAWLHAAALDGNVLAVEETSRQLRLQGNYTKSQNVLRALLHADSTHPYLSLELYLSTRQAGAAGQAEQELRAVSKETSSMGWPRPLISFYLGEAKADDVMAAARKDPLRAATRTCEANLFLAEFYEVAGQAELALPYRTTHGKECLPGKAQATPMAGRGQL